MAWHRRDALIWAARPRLHCFSSADFFFLAAGFFSCIALCACCLLPAPLLAWHSANFLGSKAKDFSQRLDYSLDLSLIQDADEATIDIDICGRHAGFQNILVNTTISANMLRSPTKKLELSSLMFNTVSTAAASCLAVLALCWGRIPNKGNTQAQEVEEFHCQQTTTIVGQVLGDKLSHGIRFGQEDFAIGCRTF